MIKDSLVMWAKLETGKITFDDIRELQVQEEQLTKLQIVGYDREEAIKLLKENSFEYLYEKAVSVESDITLSEALAEIERKEEYRRIMSRKNVYKEMR